MKMKNTITIIKNISNEHKQPAEQRAFDKAIAALEYCEKHNLTYYTEGKCFEKRKEE